MLEIPSAWPDHPDYRIDVIPCRGRAIVRVGDEVVADSTRALRVIETRHVERLYFPEQDVALDRLQANSHLSVCPFKGQASYWSHPQVEDLFWAYLNPFPEVAGIKGHLGVYQERAAVEIEFTWPDGGQAHYPFPAWGDETDLLRLMDAAPAGPDRFSAPGYHVRTRNVVEGGQLLGQAIVAAARTAEDQRVTFASINFVRSADFDDPVDLEVEQTRRGRTFSSLRISSQQRAKLVAASTLLLDVGSPDVMRHSVAMADVAGPEEAEPYDMGVVGRDIRVVGGMYGPDPDRIGPPVLNVWIRFATNPAELALRQALVAQASTHWTIAAGMLPHPGMGEAEAHVSLSTGPMAMALAFCDDAPVDEWMLYSTRAVWAGRGLVQGEGQIWSRPGTLIATYSLQAMVREMLGGAGGRDATTAM